jgi:hypothetical protein
MPTRVCPYRLPLPYWFVIYLYDLRDLRDLRDLCDLCASA